MVVVKETEETAEIEEGFDTASSSKVPDGDVTSAFAKDMSVLERRQLVETLNKQAADERSREMRATFLKMAAGSG